MPMNADRYVTVLVAVCCLVAVGAASTAMDSAVSTDPDEAIDLTTRLVPIGSDELGRLSAKVNGEGNARVSSATGAGDATQKQEGNGEPSSGSIGGSAQSNPDTSAGAQQRDSASGGAGGDSSNDASNAQSSGVDQSKDTSSGVVPAPRSLLDALLALLSDLLTPLALLALLAGIVIALARRVGWQGDGAARARAGAAVGDPAPTNDVSRAWYEMVRRLGLEGRYELTPGEHAEAAAERGANREAATELTRLFEDVRYGEVPVTDERRERARYCLDHLRNGSTELRGRRDR